MRAIAAACCAALATALVFGGTSRGGVAGAVVALASLPLAALLVFHFRETARRRRGVVALLAAMVALPLLQLVPLPPSAWSATPGREALVETYRAAGFGLPWLGMSVSAYATQRAALALLAPIAICLGVLACRRDERRWLWALVLLAGAGSILLGFLQLLDGPGGALRFYEPNDGAAAVGVFANQNHAAALLYCLVPIAAAFRGPRRMRRAGLRYLALGGFYLAVSLGLMMTGSRSALIVGLLSFALTFALILRESVVEDLGGARRVVFILAAMGALALLLAPAFGLGHILERFQGREIGAGDRATLARVTWSAVQGVFPFGSGLGTFDRVYPLYQTRETIAAAIVNHAHDDFLELALETGALGLLIAAAALGLMVWCALRNRREDDPALRRERTAAAIVLALLLAHSVVDYPLRMPALAAVFALCAATLCGALDAGRREDARG
jgi:O-antigen ligase